MIDRTQRLRQVLNSRRLDGVVCSLPVHVFMVSGYPPVIGNTLAIVNRDTAVTLLVPEDEKQLAAEVFAGEIRTFAAGSLTELKDLLQTQRDPLAHIVQAQGLQYGTIGHDGGDAVQPFTYAAQTIYGSSLRALLGSAVPTARLVDVCDTLSDARAVLTAAELDDLRRVCGFAAAGFDGGAAQLRPGLTERDVAEQFRAAIGQACGSVARCGAFTFCMSGPNAAQAYAAYQLTRDRTLRPGDLVLVHCNSYSGGLWTDITRTYVIGEPSSEQRQMYDAVLRACDSAVQAVRPGALGCDVDAAAREIMTSEGFGKEFRHGTGHGVGLSAINHNARPRIHPKSQDRLEPGMAFNIEPAIYIEGRCGMRHCTMVAVTDTGCEVLTPFHSRIEELVR